MGLIAMSERDLQRIEVLSKVIAGRMTIVSAAHVLDLSERPVRRLLERMRTDGAASIRHKAIGRPSNNRISDGVPHPPQSDLTTGISRSDRDQSLCRVAAKRTFQLCKPADISTSPPH
jgi:DNA-binding Lrp family transcriptional regulator